MKATSQNSQKSFLATEILENLTADEISNILKMKNNEIISLNANGEIFFKYRLNLDVNGKKTGEVYDSITLKISNSLKYHFILYGLKQKMKDILAVEKTKKDADGKIIYNNYNESEIKEIAKSRLEKFAIAFENGDWAIKVEKINAAVVNAKNFVIYQNILNLRLNKFDKNTALLLNKNNEDFVNEIFALNESDFNLKCKEFNL